MDSTDFSRPISFRIPGQRYSAYTVRSSNSDWLFDNFVVHFSCMGLHNLSKRFWVCLNVQFENFKVNIFWQLFDVEIAN